MRHELSAAFQQERQTLLEDLQSGKEGERNNARKLLLQSSQGMLNSHAAGGDS